MGRASRGDDQPRRLGIDGLIATAYGFAQSVPPDGRSPPALLGSGSPAPCDLNSLAALLLGKGAAPWWWILLNNDGGSIAACCLCPPGSAAGDLLLPCPRPRASSAAAVFRPALPDTTPTHFERDYAAALENGVTLIEIKVPSSEVAEDLQGGAAYPWSLSRAAGAAARPAGDADDWRPVNQACPASRAMPRICRGHGRNRAPGERP